MTFARSLPLRLFAAAKSKAEKEDRSEEVALLRRVQAGDSDAFSELVEQHWKRAFWTAYDVLHDHGRAQDVAQEAFVKVHRAIQTYDLGRDFPHLEGHMLVAVTEMNARADIDRLAAGLREAVQ